ncbi:hypothetical protein ABMA28_012168 [Loxostege sticticalis]|uniref:Chitin-binding type-2 domain-containing protein n=1 Tax=Loxostege sticticalis TaxID=481309 RepID=A0ABD0TLW2_LOXSC
MLRFVCVAAAFVALCNGQASEDRDMICKSRNAFYSVDGNCDAYIECRDYRSKEMQCPDGLHFDPKASWPNYPCSYPMDVSCAGRGTPQKALPTAECPHQYGFFPSPRATPEDCGLYLMCVEGKAIEMSCPPGLAFNPSNARCDWPDAVPSCNADAFLGFKCPAPAILENGEVDETAINYEYVGNCYAFLSCEKGHARLLMCDAGYAFNKVTGRCEDADLVKC